MARTKVTVGELAAEAGIEDGLALMRLREAGLDVRDPMSELPKNRNSLARKALDLGGPTSSRDVASLASRAGEDEEVVRGLLKSAGLIRNTDQSRIRREVLPRAEVLLGLREAPRSKTGRSTLSIGPEKQPSPMSEDQAGVAASRQQRPRKARISKLARPSYRVVGKPEPLTYLSAGDVEAIHWHVVDEFSRSRDPVDPPGVRDPNLLESAVFRPHTSLGKILKYPTLSMSAAALFHSLVLNHPFHNGNKRTALVAVIVLLDKHGYTLLRAENQLYDFVLSLANHLLVDRNSLPAEQLADAEATIVAEWLQKGIHRVSKTEHIIRFDELRRILTTCGCTFGNPSGSGIRISRGPLQTQVFYRNEGTDVPQNTVHKIRKDLELDSEHGYDSDIFYNGGRKIDDFILKHRDVLARLAKV
jgi:death-on-curing family protein